MTEKIRKVSRAVSELAVELERDPTEDESRRAWGGTPRRYASR